MINVDFDNNLMDNKTGQIVANETAPSQENTVKYPGAASATAADPAAPQADRADGALQRAHRRTDGLHGRQGHVLH